MSLKFIDQLSIFATTLESHGSQVGAHFPAVGSTFYTLAGQLKSAVSAEMHRKTTELLDGQGESARAIRYQYMYKNNVEGLPEGCQYELPCFKFQALKTAVDRQSEEENKRSSDPLSNSYQWGFPLLLQLLQLRCKGPLPTPEGMVLDLKERKLKLNRVDAARGWDTTLSLNLPSMAPANWSFFLSTINRYEDVQIQLGPDYLGADWVKQNVILPLYEAYELPLTYLDDPHYTIGQLKSWLYALGEEFNLVDVMERLPHHVKYRLRDIYFDEVFKLTNPWTGESVELSGSFDVHTSLYAEEVDDKWAPLNLSLPAEKQEILFRSTPFNSTTTALHKLPYLYQRLIMEQLEGCVRTELMERLASLKDEYPDAFTPQA